jgi:hypothetical protein
VFRGIRLNSNISIIFGALFLVLGGFFALDGVKETSWPTCDGTITSVIAKRVYRHRHTTTKYQTDYRYEVGGRDYENSNVLSDAYRKNDSIPVHYNPRRPAESTIDPQREEITGIGFALVGLLLVVFGLVRRPRHDSNDEID